MSKTKTRGNVYVEDINIGDILYEYECNHCIKGKVLTKPEFNKGAWSWKSKSLETGETIDYIVRPKFLKMAPKLWDWEIYAGNLKGDKL